MNAITATGSANARSDQLGAVPRWMLALQRVRIEHEREPEHDDQRLQDQVDDA